MCDLIVSAVSSRCPSFQGGRNSDTLPQKGTKSRACRGTKYEGEELRGTFSQQLLNQAKNEFEITSSIEQWDYCI